jgi:hypothetical protein
MSVRVNLYDLYGGGKPIAKDVELEWGAPTPVPLWGFNKSGECRDMPLDYNSFAGLHMGRAKLPGRADGPYRALGAVRATTKWLVGHARQEEDGLSWDSEGGIRRL